MVCLLVVCDMTFFGRGKRETNYVRGNQKPAG